MNLMQKQDLWISGGQLECEKAGFRNIGLFIPPVSLSIAGSSASGVGRSTGPWIWQLPPKGPPSAKLKDRKKSYRKDDDERDERGDVTAGSAGPWSRMNCLDVWWRPLLFFDFSWNDTPDFLQMWIHDIFESSSLYCWFDEIESGFRYTLIDRIKGLKNVLNPLSLDLKFYGNETKKSVIRLYRIFCENGQKWWYLTFRMELK